MSEKLQFEREGFKVIPALAPPEECALIAAELTVEFERKPAASHRRKGGLRNVFQISPKARAMASARPILDLLQKLCGRPVFAVRAIFFDKTPDANWGVPWHQDVTIAVQERVETPGFVSWSVKEGIVHVRPPEHILAEMITLRLHLDDCFADQGALTVMPGSHREGELNSGEITRWTYSGKAQLCATPRGGAVIMRPLLLHASAPARQPSHRRVLHVEYATAALPNGLNWLERL